MLSYFKPLRRKIGVVTVVMACLLMAVWVRSLVITDRISIPSCNHINPTLWSRNHLLILVMQPTEFRSGVKTFSRTIDSFDWVCVSRPIDPITDPDVTWSTSFFGFGIGTREETAVSNSVLLDENGEPEIVILAAQPRIGFKTIPYWSIVIPLTLISAWLLLGKPRAKSKPKNV